ncbi:unnamed protein product [Commensalibacter communis]|nr:unnamed protein product [Commensalibacter communis]CAI3961686.1 unnamed protein product [Commensalibacter communis]
MFNISSIIFFIMQKIEKQDRALNQIMKDVSQ